MYMINNDHGVKKLETLLYIVESLCVCNNGMSLFLQLSFSMQETILKFHFTQR